MYSFFVLTSALFLSILRLNIFKVTAKSLVFVVENGGFRKLAGKIELGSISPQELSKTF